MTDTPPSRGAAEGTARRPWLPDDFEPPARLTLPFGHHLRPIRATDVDLDLVAVTGSQPRLRSIFGAAWGWPPATLTRDQDLADLEQHAREMREREAYNYALFDADETALLGCVYVDPPEKVCADADVSWWVVDECVGTDVEDAVAVHVPPWIAEAWPFERPRFIGRDVTWAEWLSLPDVDPQH